MQFRQTEGGQRERECVLVSKDSLEENWGMIFRRKSDCEHWSAHNLWVRHLDVLLGEKGEPVYREGCR